MTYAVRLTDQTRDAIFAQARYIAVDGHAPLNAARWLDHVMDAIESLGHFPRRCPLPPENEKRPFEIRKITVGDYGLLFTIDDDAKTVWVIGFRHSSRLERPDELPLDAPTD